MLTAYCLVLLLTGTTARLFSTPSTKGHTNSAFAPAPVYNVDGNWKSVEGSGAEPPGSPRLDLLDSCNELYRDTLLDHFSWVRRPQWMGRQEGDVCTVSFSASLC